MHRQVQIRLQDLMGVLVDGTVIGADIPAILGVVATVNMPGTILYRMYQN